MRPDEGLRFHATTVVAVRHRGTVAVAGDGQVTLGQTVVKGGARKVRKLHHGRVLAGFAGAAADAFTLFARFEGKLDEHRGNLQRAAVELAKEWRTDRAMRRLEALLAVADFVTGIPFNKTMEFAYGVPRELAPGIVRLVANNPSPFTFHGTNTYLIGSRELALIDPGPEDEAHFEAIMRTAAGRSPNTANTSRARAGAPVSQAWIRRKPPASSGGISTRPVSITRP